MPCSAPDASCWTIDALSGAHRRRSRITWLAAWRNRQYSMCDARQFRAAPVQPEDVGDHLSLRLPDEVEIRQHREHAERPGRQRERTRQQRRPAGPRVWRWLPLRARGRRRRCVRGMRHMRRSRARSCRRRRAAARSAGSSARCPGHEFSPSVFGTITRSTSGAKATIGRRAKSAQSTPSDLRQRYNPTSVSVPSRLRHGLSVQMRIFGFAGWSGSGKTTLIEQHRSAL